MMSHEECLEYLENNPELQFPKNDTYVVASTLTFDFEYVWIENGSCYPISDYLGDALINWHKQLNA